VVTGCVNPIESFEASRKYVWNTGDSSTADIAAAASEPCGAVASVSSWQGRTVLVPVNPLRETADGLEHADTGGRPPTEVVASLLPGALVVKGFNTYPAQVLAESPVVNGGRRLVLLAGDDAVAKRKVTDLADSADFQAVDTGTLAEGGSVFDSGGPRGGRHPVPRHAGVHRTGPRHPGGPALPRTGDEGRPGHRPAPRPPYRP
ncbi:NADPH-dependent F420 reductase, partial [Streptomyces sp. NPDC002536]